MRTQIRQGVFETNSSSMHALALQKDFTLNCEQCAEIYKDIIPEHMTVRLSNVGDCYETDVYENDKFRDLTPVEVTESKINLVYSNIITRFPNIEERRKPLGYINLTLFFSWLTKLGIKYDIQFEERFIFPNTNKGEIIEGYICDPMYDELFEHIYDGTEESFCNFLFGDGSKLDGYETDSSWCTDENEDKFWKELENNDKCVTFGHYGG